MSDNHKIKNWNNASLIIKRKGNKRKNYITCGDVIIIMTHTYTSHYQYDYHSFMRLYRDFFTLNHRD